ncbi:hypothetical protein HPB49_004498 [Dermacentor silvarum]|uniref:Uncharacterized protein n=1 Tax=Dermacentor silvarum TaxID=543639 RepID=A0ACB8DV12_DERSI|nr:hypothetical protein HPB49_004498 [Dermacentor silvarum]
MGKNGAALITFESSKLPRKIHLYSTLLPVIPYHTNAAIRETCHKIGRHKNWCLVIDQHRCSLCGHPAHGNLEICPAVPLCRNCGDQHVATDPKCPARQLATKTVTNGILCRIRLSRRKERQQQAELRRGNQTFTPTTRKSPASTQPLSSEQYVFPPKDFPPIQNQPLSKTTDSRRKAKGQDLRKRSTEPESFCLRNGTPSSPQTTPFEEQVTVPKYKRAHRAYAEALCNTRQAAEMHPDTVISRTVRLDIDQLSQIVGLVTTEVIKRMLPLLVTPQISRRQEIGFGRS